VDGDGHHDLCGRAEYGIACALADRFGGFGTLQRWSASRRTATAEVEDFSDAEGWATDEAYYATIRFGDIDGDGKADVCGRGPTGILCARSSSNSFERARRWLAAMKDADGWLPARYSTTIALADVNGDGRADVCARGKDGIVCGLSTGSAFGELRKWSTLDDFSDRDACAWGSDAGYYGTIRFADLNGDGRADICGRRSDGIVCALSTGRSFTKATSWLSGGMTDREGWLSIEQSASIQL